MKNYTLLITLAFTTIVNICYAQETTTEIVKTNGVDNKITITTGDLYKGTTSEKAREYYNKAGEYDNDLKNAENYLLKAIKEDSKYIEAYDNLGLVYRRMKEFDKAIIYYKKSIELYPKGIMAHQNLAAVYGLQNDYNSAITEYNTILEISPNDPEGYFGIANSYMVLNKLDEALVNAKKALEIYENTSSNHLGDGYHLIGLINYYKEDFDNAKKYIQLAKDKGVKIHPQIEKDLFSDEPENKKDYQLKNKEDYAQYEEDMIKFHNWLLVNPIDYEPATRKQINSFAMQWMTGSPNVTIELSSTISPYIDNADCLIIFMTGWTKYALETRDFKDKVKGSIAGTESVIEFYNLNKKTIGTIKSIEKLKKLQSKNKLEEFIKSNI